MNEPRVPTQTPPRRRKRPPQWRHINFPTRGISRLHPAPPRPVRQQARDVWDRVRLLIRSATLWLLFSAVLLYHRWYITAAIAFAVSFTFVVFRPYIREVRMHADEDFGTDSAEFLSTVAGATGVPMIGGNRLEILNNGEEFYPAMLAAISGAKYSITMEQYIFRPVRSGGSSPERSQNARSTGSP